MRFLARFSTRSKKLRWVWRPPAKKWQSVGYFIRGRIVDLSRQRMLWGGIATCTIETANALDCFLANWLDVRFPRQVAVDRQVKKRDSGVLLEEVVGHLQVMLNTISFERRMKNTLCFGGVERDDPIGAPQSSALVQQWSFREWCRLRTSSTCWQCHLKDRWCK